MEGGRSSNQYGAQHSDNLQAISVKKNTSKENEITVTLSTVINEVKITSILFLELFIFLSSSRAGFRYVLLISRPSCSKVWRKFVVNQQNC